MRNRSWPQAPRSSPTEPASTPRAAGTRTVKGMVRLRSGRSSARRADSAQYGEYTEHDEYVEADGYDQPVEAQIVDLDDAEPNASDDARAIRSACEAIVRY